MTVVRYKEIVALYQEVCETGLAEVKAQSIARLLEAHNLQDLPNECAALDKLYDKMKDQNEETKISVAKMLTFLANMGAAVNFALLKTTVLTAKLIEKAAQIHPTAAVGTILSLSYPENWATNSIEELHKLDKNKQNFHNYQRLRPFLQDEEFTSKCDEHFFIYQEWEWMNTILPHIDVDEPLIWYGVGISICLLSFLGYFEIFPGSTFNLFGITDASMMLAQVLCALVDVTWQQLVAPILFVLAVLLTYEALVVCDYLITSTINYLHGAHAGPRPRNTESLSEELKADLDALDTRLASASYLPSSLA